MWLFPAESLTQMSWAQGTPNQSEQKFFSGDSRKEGGNGGGVCEVAGGGSITRCPPIPQETVELEYEDEEFSSG